jgi:hypothetical protein
MEVQNALDRMWKGAVVAYFKVLSREFPGQTKERSEEPRSESLVSRPRFKLSSSVNLIIESVHFSPLPLSWKNEITLLSVCPLLFRLLCGPCRIERK